MKKKNIILINVCITKFAKYDNEFMQRFWSKIKKKFEKTINHTYVKVNKHINDLIIKRKVNIKVSHKLKYATRDEDYN